MAGEEHKVSLGFTDHKYPPGVHICQIYSDDDERQEALLKFILSGLDGKERVACFSENIIDEAVDEFLANYSISYAEVCDEGSFTLSGTRSVYFHDGCFEAERMLCLLKDFYLQSKQSGYAASRVIGEMVPEIHSCKGGSRLLEYESRVTMLLEEYPVTAVCQYDARVFGGETIMNVLKVHPLMIVRSTVVQNPFYISPKEFLSGMDSPSCEDR